MNIIDRIRGRRPATPLYSSHETGAYGGVPARIQPALVGDTFTFLPMGGIMASGIAPRIAARPPGGTMLASAEYHTGIPSGTGFVGQKHAVNFTRLNAEVVSPRAVDAVSHLQGRVHPGLSRQTLRGRPTG